MLWVIKISVVLCFLFSLNNNDLMSLLFLLLRLVEGLLVNKILGVLINVWVIVICCCLLFDNCDG